MKPFTSKYVITSSFVFYGFSFLKKMRTTVQKNAIRFPNVSQMKSIGKRNEKVYVKNRRVVIFCLEYETCPAV